MAQAGDFRNLRPISIEERCEIELGIIEKFDVFARKNGLRYWLFWGTLLGAVRHRGFIPWDDDIDIAMPREDYLRLIELMKSNPLESERIRLNAYEIDAGYTRPFAKLCDTRTLLFEDFDLSYIEEGVYVDVFPLMAAPDDEADCTRLRKRWRKNFALLGLSKGRLVPHKSKVKTIAKAILKPYATMKGYEAFLAPMCSDLAKTDVPFESSSKLVSLEESVRFFESRWFEDTVLLPFEHLELPAPKSWDEILRALYGDYMILPPEEERRPHQSKAFWKLGY